MAIVKESPIGVVSGKLGQIAGAKWKGINYLRVIPASVANPRTEDGERRQENGDRRRGAKGRGHGDQRRDRQ